MEPKKKLSDFSYSDVQKENQLLQALNAATTSLQKSAHSETAVYTTFCQELQNLGLNGAISTLDESGEYLIVRALMMPDRMRKALQAIERFIGTSGVGYKYRLKTAVIDQKVLSASESFFLEDNNEKLNQVFPEMGFLGRQALRSFANTPAIIAPIIIDGQTTGVLYVAGSQLQPANIVEIDAFANQISASLQDAYLFQALRLTEAQYRRLFETANDAIFVVDAASLHIMSANPKAEAMSGYDEAELLTMTIDQLLPQAAAPAVMGLTELVRQQSVITESVLLRADGQSLIVEISATTFDMNGRLLLQGFIRDITEAKRSESLQTAVYQIATIANSDITLDELYHSIHASVGELMDARNFYIALYDHQQDMLKLPYFVDERDGYDGRPYKAGNGLTEYVIHSGLPQLIDDNAHDSLIRQNIVQEIGPRAKIWLGVPLKNKEQTFGAIVVQNYGDRGAYTEQEKQFLVFVSGQIAAAIERKRAESELKKLAAELEQQVRLMDVVLSATPDHFFIYDLDGRHLYVNPSGLESLGFALNEVLGKSLRDLNFPAEYVDPFEENLVVVLRSGQSALTEVQIHGQNGRKYFEVYMHPVRNQDNQIVSIVVSSHEFTERKHAEEILHHSQKVESLGILAGGVAHDFNNLLVAMLGQTSLALTMMSAEEPARAHILKAVKAAERASDLTNQLLAYSGRGQFTIQLLQIDTIIRENEHLLALAIPPNVRLDLSLSDDLPLIEADPGQIQQIVMNLILNAVEAIGADRGVIKISTNNKTILDNDLSDWQRPKHSLKPGKYVLLTVQDDGSGMDEETINRIFDPFFTTKFTGRGLGLAAVLGIMRSHKGALRVLSRPGEGTTFDLLFPVADSQRKIVHTFVRQSAQTKSRRVVLVIDDEKPVREAVKDILGSRKIEVLTAENGRSGIDIYRRHEKTIDLILLDWSMPDMNGKETFAALRQINPQVRVLISSGYSEGETIHRLETFQPVGFLQKPYSLTQLVEEINRYLE